MSKTKSEATIQVKGRVTVRQSRVLWNHLQDYEMTFSGWLRKQITKLEAKK